MTHHCLKEREIADLQNDLHNLQAMIHLLLETNKDAAPDAGRNVQLGDVQAVDPAGSPGEGLASDHHPK